MGILRESYRCNKMTMDISPDDLIEFTELTSQPIILPAEGSGEGGAGAGRGGGAGAGAGGPAAAALGRRLLLAARAGDTPAVLDLMAQGAPFTTDWLGTSALHLAAGGAHAALCAVLLRAGVSRDARSKVERTPLHVAAHAGHAAAAAVLLRHGAPPDPRDLLRMTPLHWAAARGHAAVAALLLRAGADPAAVSKFRKTPPQLAREAGHRDVLRLLEDALRDRERLRERQREPTEAADARRPLSTDFVEIDRDSESGAAAPSGAAAAGEEGAGAALLRRHGITLLPPDDGGTVLSALRSGRSVVLSDAGKLMLKESGAPPAPAPAPPCPRPAAARGVVLKATPVRGPPEPGVKIFTLNNKRPAPAPAAAPAPAPPEPPVSDDARPPTTTSGLGELPAGGAPRPQRRLKYVQLPPPAKIALGGAGGGRQAVKIIMNKANFDKLLADAGCAAPATPAPAAPAPATPAELRAALAAAQARARRLQRELDACRARLALYEP